jgi:hypothetical protein
LLVEMNPVNNIGYHFMEPSAFRLYERFADAGLGRKLLRTVVPPLLSGVLWSTSLPSPLCTTPSRSSIRRALLRCALFFLTSGVPS